MEEKKYSGVLILAETEHGKVHRVAYELLNKGRMIADACGESLSCLLRRTPLRCLPAANSASGAPTRSM